MTAKNRLLDTVYDRSQSIPAYGAMLVKSSTLAKDFMSATSTRLMKKSLSPTYLIFNEVKNINESLKMTKTLGD